MSGTSGVSGASGAAKWGAADPADSAGAAGAGGGASDTGSSTSGTGTPGVAREHVAVDRLDAVGDVAADALHFGVPIIAIDYLKLNSSPTALEKWLYKVYSSCHYPDDRSNPRIKLVGDDSVVGMVVADPEATLLTACANGYGKRTPFGPNLEVGEEQQPPGAEAHEDEALDAELPPAPQAAVDHPARVRGQQMGLNVCGKVVQFHVGTTLIASIPPA